MFGLHLANPLVLLAYWYLLELVPYVASLNLQRQN